MTMNSTNGHLQSLEEALSALQTNSDLFFKIMMACMIFCIGSVFYWGVGYAFAYGPGNKFIGTDWFFMKNMPSEQVDDWFFQFVFAATAATIVSGSMAERTEFVAYLVYSVILTGFIYPVVTHWAWSDDGWLTEMPNNEHIGFQDFAGSAVVHILGGSVALIGAAMLGPRIGRFDDNGKVLPIHGHTVPLAALGGFILFFGFLGFNGGSQGSISNAGDGVVVAESIVNTVLSGGVGALCALFIKLVFYKGNLWSLLTTINGGLTGMVAICAGCDVVDRWGAFVIGLVAGMVFIVVSNLMLKFKIDDPLDAVAVHMGGGFWGIIAVTLFARDTGIVYAGDSDSFLQLLWNIVGSVSIFAWSVVTSLLMFGVMRAVGILRVSSLIEEKGLDIAKHGEAAYPLTSYGHGWVNIVEVETGLNGKTKPFDTVPNHIRRESCAGGIENIGYSQDNGNKNKPVINSQIEESFENLTSQSTNF